MSERSDLSEDQWRGPNTIATHDVGNVAYMRVVLRDDQLDLIRQIVREEIARAKA